MMKKRLGDLFRCVRVGARDAADALDVALMALPAHRLKRSFLGVEIVVEARLPDAEHVGDVLGRGAVVAAPREHLRGGFEHLGKSTPRARHAAR